jgi:hypothetical protein
VFILHSQQHCITIRFSIALSHSCILDTILLKLFKGEFAVVPTDNIQIVHYFDHGYLEEEKSMIHSFTVTFGAKYLTGIVTSVPPYETFSLTL